MRVSSLTMASLPFLAVLLVLATPSFSTAEKLEKSWTLSHSFGSTSGTFTKRGVVTLRIHDSDNDSDNASDSVAAAAVSLEMEHQVDLTEAEIADMLAAGWYQIQLQETGRAGSHARPIRTSVPACQLRRANFRDELVLTLGSHANLISVAYMPKISPLAPADCDGLPAVAAGSGAAVTLQTDVSWETDVPGMMLRTVLPQYNPPPGLKYLKSTTTTGSSSGSDGNGATTDKPPASITGKGSSGSGSDGDESEEEMDSSFMAFIKKYWYVMLPLILTNLISSPAAKEGEGKEGAGGAQGQGAAPSAVAAAAAESPKPASQRRGKRG